ncbi:hypothetical protein MMC12_008535 [Toensbergia leucococca]|nr:hypothetical protein [Toensbergia leucococca]
MLSVYAIILPLILHFAVAQISRTGWKVTADSYESGTNNAPANAIDGNTSTFWHTEWTPVNVPLPHNITFDMLQTYYVDSLSYLPRQDGVSNGNIGEHQIVLSTDGVTWSKPVAIGTYIDDNTLKTTTFLAVPARYLRLIALSEAGNRGPWTSAAEINVFAASTYTAASTSLGQWTTTVDFPLVPAAAAVDHGTGRVIAWSSFEPNTFSGDPGTGDTITATYDPATGLVSQRNVSNTGHDMFCPGISMDVNGRPVVTGGNDADKTTVYDPVADAWTSVANMQIPRGYQASATCSDGRIFTIGGSWSGGEGGKNGEIYDPVANTWTLLPGCPVGPMLTNDTAGVYRQDNHGWLFGWKNGTVFQAGPSKAMNWYGTTGTGSQFGAGLRASDPDSMCGNAIMYDAANGKILTVGGSPDYQDSYATTNAHIITIGAPDTTPTVTTLSSMTYARAFGNGVVLPDGKVIIIGGQSYAVPFSDNTATLYPEMWDPATSKFTVLNPMAIPRVYHSIALLLPDATVLSGGGGLCGSCTTNHDDAEIFSPPYLFTSTGALATRPQILSTSATTVKVGAKFTINMNSAVTAFSLIRYGSTTHTVDTDQRRIALVPLASGLTYTVTVPNDPGIALPGYWMLFALNSAGVPSVATTILVQGS